MLDGALVGDAAKEIDGEEDEEAIVWSQCGGLK